MTQSIACGSRDQWLTRRQSLITGTDAARILGVSSFGGPMNVYLEKLGLAKETEVNNAMRMGRRFERPILEEYAEQEAVELVFDDPYTILISPTKPIIGATLDARRVDVTPAAPVDAKNVRYADGEKWGNPGTDEIPIYYATQLILQMHVTGADFADLAVLFSGQDLCSYRLHRNPTLESEVIQRCEDFWSRHVEAEEPPTVDGSPSYTRYLQDYVKQQTEAIIAADGDMNERARILHEVRAEIDQLEAQEELHKNIMKATIGEAKTLVGGCWKANWTQAKDGTKTDYKAIAYELAADLTHHVGEKDPTQVMAPYVTKHTATTPGSRRFTFNYKG